LSENLTLVMILAVVGYRAVTVEWIW